MERAVRSGVVTKQRFIGCGCLAALIWVPAVTAEAASASEGVTAVDVRAMGLNLVYNGDFDNGIWYERYRGWSPAGWYQWFTCGDDAPEHTVGRDKPHTGKEYVRIHMWAHAWRGGILQNIRDVEPGHWYRLRAYGWFAKTAEDPRPQARVGLEPLGKLREQFGVDVTKHPAPAYNECVGADEWPDLPESTVWTDYHDYYNDWGRFEVIAEARSDVVTAILYCDPRQRPGDQPIYEMNWDSVSLYRVPWPTKRLVDEGAEVPVNEGLSRPVVTVQPELKTAQVTWRSKAPAGAAQVLYRFLDSEAVTHQSESEQDPSTVRTGDFPFESVVAYESSATSHWIELDPVRIPESAVELQAVGLSRICVEGECETHCSPLGRLKLN